MAKPTFFGDGYTPRRSDPKRVVWCKKLGEYQDSIGISALPQNDPAINDTIRVLMQKLLCARNSVSYTG